MQTGRYPVWLVGVACCLLLHWELICFKACPENSAILQKNWTAQRHSHAQDRITLNLPCLLDPDAA